jgi:adhesin transport system membrane fusion protein
MAITMSPLDELKKRRRPSAWRLLGWTAAGLIIAFVAWARTASFDQFATALGEVTPSDKVKVIQHLEGGMIKNLYVTDGQVVAPEDPLVELQLAVTGTNPEELAARLDGLNLTRARLMAESRGIALVLPSVIAVRHPDLAAAEQAAYDAHKIELANRLQSAQDRVTQQELAVSEMVATANATSIDLGLSRKNLAMSADLLKDGLTSKMDHLEKEREVKLLEGKLETLQSSIPKAKAALAEAERDFDDEKFKDQSEILEHLGRIEQEIASVKELLAEAQDQSLRRLIRSPVAGIVKNMHYHTIGGVVGAGTPIMEIVPTEEKLVIEARLRPEDVGNVKLGQSVRIKVSAYDYIRFGALEGTLTYISADSLVDDEGLPYFQVRVKPERAYLGAKEGELPIRPGMTASVDIRTGAKTVLEYLLKPVIRLRYDALHER